MKQGQTIHIRRQSNLTSGNSGMKVSTMKHLEIEMTSDNDLIRRVQHKKRGSTYKVIGRGRVQSDTPLTDMDEVVIYQGEADGLFWLRPESEFVDGRFVELPSVAASQPFALETCGRCMGSGYGGHPDSGALCIDCNGSGGAAASQPADPVTNADSRQRVTVKPLVWSEFGKEAERANSLFGVYTVMWGAGIGGDVSYLTHAGWLKKFPTNDAAKAAAQTDYEARVLAAIDVQPADHVADSAGADIGVKEMWPDAWHVAEASSGPRGFWKPCCGCHELIDGYQTGPIHPVLKCYVGVGCGECGGIGAVWDTTDYADMGAYISSLSDELSDYDAGLLNDWGGGNVSWWQDYLRAEIGRANDFWRAQLGTTHVTETPKTEHDSADVQPDPRDAQIAALVEAVEQYLAHDTYSIAPMRAAIAALKGGDA
jgi:hypothetical protein